MMDSADELIEQLRLEPHPEGGWYREMWRGPAGSDGRAIGTSILFLLKAGEASHWHRVDAHELWLWQMGDPLQLRLFMDGQDKVRIVSLGPDQRSGNALQAMVEPDEWQAASRLADVPGEFGYTLVSCVVTPGFDFAGFELAPPDWKPPTSD